MLDVQKILREGHPDLVAIVNQLDSDALRGLSEDLTHDIEWRSSHLGRPPTYWQLVSPDFARQLSGGSSELPDSAITTYDGLEVDRQMIHTTPLYEDAQIVRSNFRLLHRPDGK